MGCGGPVKNQTNQPTKHQKKTLQQNPPNEGLDEETSTTMFLWNILQFLLLGNVTPLHKADCRADMFLCLCPSHQFWLFKTEFPLMKGKSISSLHLHRQVFSQPLCFQCFSYHLWRLYPSFSNMMSFLLTSEHMKPAVANAAIACGRQTRTQLGL